jgi:hypothetical protein
VTGGHIRSNFSYTPKVSKNEEESSPPLYKVKDLLFDDEVCVIFLLVEGILYKERNCSNYSTKMILNENR